MQFGDYSPPALPSPEQQRAALQKGLGRAVQWALTGRLHDEPLLAACLRDQRFDAQCEASRGDWLWEMVRAAGATDRFRVPILHALYELADQRSADQLCELAQCYGVTGDEAFRSRLYGIVEQKPFPNYSPSLGEEEILTLDGEPAFLFAARVRGESLPDREWEWDDGSLLHFAVKHFGAERVSGLLEASTDPAIRRFWDCWRRDEHRKAGQDQRISQQERNKAVSVVEIIREAEGETKCYWFRGWGRQVTDADLQIVLQRLWTEQEPEIIVKLLRIFSGRPLPDFDARLIELCTHGNEDVRRWAFKALEQNTHPLIREFLLAEIKRGKQDSFVIGLFINNYQQGDEQRILEAMELPAAACQHHWFLSDVIEILEKHPAADCSRLTPRAALRPLGARERGARLFFRSSLC